MTCSSFGSTSLVSVWYTADTYPTDAPLPPGDAIEWRGVPITSESLNATLSSTISEIITPQRSYAGSLLTQGEVGGDIGIEAQAGPFLFNMLISVLQSTNALDWAGTGANWAKDADIQNESDVKCFAFMKRVEVGTGSYDYYIFRGCQVGALTLDIASNALISGSVTISGVRPDEAVEASAMPVAWVMEDFPPLPLMSGVHSLKSLKILDSVGADTGGVFQNFNITFDNQLRQQQAVGLGHAFAAGVASGRFMASCSGSTYYASPQIYNDFLNDSELKVEGTLQDSDDNGIHFLLDLAKVTSGSLPDASGPDQDLVVATELRAFESAANGTVLLTKLTA